MNARCAVQFRHDARARSGTHRGECTLAPTLTPSVPLMHDVHEGDCPVPAHPSRHPENPERSEGGEGSPFRRSTATMMTAEEFLMASVPDATVELVRGELRVTPPAGGSHGVAAINLVVLLSIHARATGAGRAFADGVGYELVRLPHTVRVPDGSFVRAHRLPEDGIGPGLLKIAPDLAIEVLSPSETASELQEKLDDYELPALRSSGSSIRCGAP